MHVFNRYTQSGEAHALVALDDGSIVDLASPTDLSDADWCVLMQSRLDAAAAPTTVEGTPQ
jgi:hypothetical protein